MNGSTSRLIGVDLVKIIAMFCVICLHSTYSYIETWIGSILYRSSVIAVPLFFMVSGYLVLGKENINYNYILRKCFGIIRYVLLITTIVWIVFGSRTLNNYLCTSFGSFVQLGKMSVFWYLGAMLMIYLLTPLLQKVLYKQPKLFNVSLLFLFFTTNIIFSLNYFDIHIDLNTIQTFRLWNWLLYYCIGGYIKKTKMSFNINPWVILFLFVINFIYQSTSVSVVGSAYCEYFYSSLVVQILSASVFFYILSLKIESNSIISSLSNLFLPVYTFHMFVIWYINAFFEKYIFFGGEVNTLIYVSLSISISVMISLFIMKFPISKKIFKI